MAGNCIKANTEICLRAPNAQNDKTNGSSVTQITCSLYRSRASNVDYRTFQTDASQSECVRYPRAGLHRGVATGWTGVDMSTLLLPEVVPVIDANPVSFYSGEGGLGLVMVCSLIHPSLPYVQFKVTILEVTYKSGQQFEENIRHSTVIASEFLHDPLTNGFAPGPRWGLRPRLR